MASQTPGNARRTALYAEHQNAKAKIVDFAGWEMPVQYSGVLDEHKTVRTAVGLFDVSHMGEVLVTGRGALEFLQKMVTNDLSKVAVGQAQYSALCYENGTLVDDIVVYRKGADSFFICVNASNVQKDFEWLQSHVPKAGVSLENLSDEYSQIAIQGPKARDLMAKAVDIKLQDLRYYHFAEGKVMGVPSTIARTGYTGELGYEIYIPNSAAPMVWRGLLEVGAEFGVKPCGLGARDTLRLEMGYLLYGNDMDDTTTALECGLQWVTKFDKGEFLGAQTLKAQKEKGLSRKLVGFEMVDKAIGRHGYPVFATETAQESCGVVTSGSVGPTVGKNVGMAYLPVEKSAVGETFWIEIRNERKKAVVAKKPFYTNGTANS